MKTRRISLILVAALIVSMAAGNLFASGQQDGAEEKSSGALSAALLLPGAISDYGWNYTAYTALKSLEENLGCDIAYTENVPASDYEEIFRGYATAGYDVIIGHGFEFGEAAKKVAKEFPEQKFILTSTDVHQAPNVAAFRINDPESGFVQGALSAMLTKTGIIGSIGGMEIPPIINQQKGYVAGAKYINPDVEIKTVYTGSFHDVAKGKEMAKAFIAEGVDIITGDADETNHGIIEAAAEAGDDVWFIGSAADQAPINPDTVCTSTPENFSIALQVIVKDIMEGNFKPIPYEMGLVEGVVTLAPFRKFDDKISDEVKTKINQIMEDLKSGKIDIDHFYNY